MNLITFSLLLSSLMFNSPKSIAAAGITNSEMTGAIANEIASLRDPSFEEILKRDLAKLRTFTEIASITNPESPFQKRRKLSLILKWAKEEALNQLGEYNPALNYIEWRLSVAQGQVDQFHFEDAARYLNTHVTEILTLID